MNYLDGENIKPASNSEAKGMIGISVVFLRSCDIDKSGRGYFFPRRGVIEGVSGQNIIINGDYISLSDLMEVVKDEQTNN